MSGQIVITTHHVETPSGRITMLPLASVRSRSL